MKNFSWNIIGHGKTNLVFLHGWGINSKIWHYVVKELKIFFKIHLIDLPGLGINKNLCPLNIVDTISLLYTKMPKNAIWIGWSIGGLIASQYALTYPKNILGLITVSSSPCFLLKKDWPGIKNNFLKILYQNLINNYDKTIHNFLSFHTINIVQSNQKKILEKILLDQSKPSLNVLKNGLEILCTTDLRSQIKYIKIPFLRIYGALDTLVPKKIAYILDGYCINSHSIIINHTSHLPFISHKKFFCSLILKFIKKITF